MAFIGGCLVGAAVTLLYRRLRRPKAVPPDEAALAYARQTAREYRNFMTYDGFTGQEGYDE